MRNLVLCSMLTAASLSSQAATFCATDGASLQTALQDAMANNESDSIRLAAGVYSRAQGFTITVAPGESIDLIGGWNAAPNPCLTLSADATLTRIDGLGSNPGVYVYMSAGSANALVANLTVEHVWHNSVPSSALYVGPQSWNTAYAGNVLVERVIVQDSRSYYGIFAGGYGQSRVRGSVVVHNQLESAIAIGAFGNQGGAVVNSTVAHNVAGSSGADFIRSFRFVEGVASTFSNNILQQNVTGGVERDLSSAEFTDVWLNNIIGGTRYALGNASQGTIWGAKAIFVAPELRDYRLSGTSVGINTGIVAPVGGAPAVDVHGRTRPFGAGMDLGAHETAILFHDGFE